MKMQSKRMVALMCVATLVGVYGTAYAMGSKPHKGAQEKMARESVYMCQACKTMALKAGDCPTCKKPLEAMHLLGTKDGTAMVCACSADCQCDAKGMKDGKCACGSKVEMVACKGMYACPMGCPNVSATAGKCACGMEMKKVE
jgi:hypothetical protein